MIKVQSTNISSVEYNEETGELTVVFKSGGEMVFQGVTPEEYQDFLQAPSAGKYFNAKIKPTKKSRVVRAHKKKR